MKNKIYLWGLLSLLLLSSSCRKNTNGDVREVDICIYGGTSAGVITAYTAKLSGKSVLLIEPGHNLGGMSSGGLGYTDIGNKYVVQGLALDFYRRLGKHYGKLEQWIFEPSVAESVFLNYIEKANVEVLYETRLAKVNKHNHSIESIVVENTAQSSPTSNKTVKAKVFIDCSYEGDLMAKAGVSYSVGRESNRLYDETYNGVQLMDGHQLPGEIDPYVIKGDKNSGLLYGITSDTLAPAGTGDRKVQAYNFRICLTNQPENRIPITKPDNYDPSKYELLLRLKEIRPWKSFTDVFTWSRMPNGKTDINNYGGFSTDVIGESWNYPEADYAERARIWKSHEDYTKGLLYFVGHDERIPEFVRNGIMEWGYPKDEYLSNNHWTHQLYIRECRRMIGELVMTQHHCQGREIVSDGIGWAAYTMDSHNCERIVVNGMTKNEGNVEIGGFGPYPISYRAITPKREEATNLLVPVCLSASHIAYGSIRMEPVFMVLGQMSAIAANLAIDQYQGKVQDVPATEINNKFKNNPLADSSIPEILIDNNNDEKVVLTGEWKPETDARKAYGPDFYSDDSKGSVFKSTKYIPDIPQTGNYNIYLFSPSVDNATSHTLVSLFDGSQQKDILIDNAAIVVEGQTSGEWVSVGKFQLSAGKGNYFEITNKKADGVIVADAVLFIPERTEK